MSRTTADPLLSTRATLVLLLATLVGVGAGVLGFLSGQSWPTAVLTGVGAAGGALLLFHTIVGDTRT